MRIRLIWVVVPLGLLAAALVQALVAGLTLGFLLTEFDRPSPTLTTAPPPIHALDSRSVGGYLFGDVDGDGHRGVDEEPLVGHAVAIYGTGPLPIARGVTDSLGRFLVDNVSVSGQVVDVRTAPRLPTSLDGVVAEPALQQHTPARLGVPVTVPVSEYGDRCADVSACPTVRLPDLVPVDPTDPEHPGPNRWTLDRRTTPGRVLLRFGSAAVNRGGLLHVVGRAVQPDGRQLVEQWAYGPGKVLVRPAGTFVYHPAHHHIHLDDFERYELIDAAGRVVAGSGKVSFCLTDVLQPEPQRATPSWLTLDLPPMQCNAVEQGIDPGFADYYGPALAGQSIDVTAVPAGRYRLRVTVDPQNHLLESNETNNVIEVSVALPS